MKMLDGRLVFFQAVPLSEDALAEVLTWGKPSALVVGHEHHVVDADAFAKRLGLKTYGPKEREELLRTKVELSGTLEAFPADSSVQVESVAGTRKGEPVMLVRSGEGQRLSLLFTDALQNNRGNSLLMRAGGFIGGPKVPPMFRLLFLRHAKALRVHFERLAAMPGLTRLVPCHGKIVSDDAARVLRRVAASL